MTTPRRTTSLLALLAFALTLAALACTSDDPQPTATPTPSPSPTPEATQTPTPRATPTPIVSPRAPTPPPTTTARILPPGLRVRTFPGGPDLGRLPAQERVTVVGHLDVDLPQPATWLGLEGLGWIRYHRNSIELRGDFEALPELDYFDLRPNAPLHRDDTRTGIPAVDNVIDAVLTMDTATLASLVEIREQPCEDSGAAFIPWTCPEGVDLGTPVAKFNIGACGGDHGPAEELPLYIEALFDLEHQGYQPEPTSDLTPLHLYAIFESDPGIGGYVAFFAYFPGSIGRRLSITEAGTISSIGYGCGDPIGIALPRDLPVVLAPYIPPQLLPPSGITAPPPTGIPAIDAVVTAVQARDAATLISMVETTEVECLSADQAGYDYRCADLGLEPGDTYEGISVGNCDAGLVPADAIPAFFAEFVDPGTRAITPYGAYFARDEIYLGRTAVVMFTDPEIDPPMSYRQIRLTEGRITSIGASCGNSLPLQQEVGVWLVTPAELGYDVPPPDIDPAATTPEEGSPFDGADLILALHDADIPATPYHEGIGVCGRSEECGTGVLYLFGAPERAGSSYLWVYETSEARAAEWELAPDGRATQLVGSPHPGAFYGNANLVLLQREPLDETARFVIDVLLSLTP